MSHKDSVCCPEIKHKNLVGLLSAIPLLILENHDHHALADTVLSKISDAAGFDFFKAAYLKENQEFGLLRGICGYNKQEVLHGNNGDYCLLETPHKYSQKIKSFNSNSCLSFMQEKEFAKKFGDSLEMENPSWIWWKSKNNNHGILFYNTEKEDLCDWKKLLLPKLVSLLCFC